ncbi:MAG: polysaccharide biosynthesis C-terminal domain-containing protein [Butyrivibrio sp.]|nr:polysaccharide biosynthesis C-terminal domain-containing protein [Butyrivibrio sp.]
MRTYTEEKRIRPDILTAAVFWSVTIMMLYNIISVRIFGDTGSGFSAGPLTLYFLLYVSFVLAVQKAVYIMVRLRARRSQFLNAETNKDRSFKIFVFIGILLSVLIMSCSYVIARNFFAASKIYIDFILIGVSLLFLCPQGVIRGYLQGLGYTKPIMICDLTISVVSFSTGAIISGILYNYGIKVNKIFHGDEYSAIYGASGMIIGVLIGSIVGFVQISISMMVRKKEIADIVKNGAPRYLDNKNDVLTGIRPILYLYATPVLMCLVDNIFYNLVLIKNDKAQDMIASYGAFAGRVESFMIMIAFLTCIPFIKSWNRVMARIERDELEGARDRLKRLLHFGSMLFVPVTIFMFTAAKEIQIAFFGKYSSLIDGMPQIGAFVMFALGLAIFLSWLLNHMGKSVLLVISLTIGWVVHIFFMILLVMMLRKELLGVIISQLVAFVVYDIFCFSMLFKMLKYRQRLLRNFGFPILAAAAAGLVLMLLNKLLVDHIGEVLSLIIGAVVYTVVYMLILILIKGVKTEELEKIPFGRLFMGFSHAVQHDRYYEE